LSRETSETTTGPGEPAGGREVQYAYDAAADLTGITWPDAGAWRATPSPGP
jgi:YD repeat-containing protein